MKYNNYSHESLLGSHGSFFWRLVRQANWTKKQVMELFLKKFNATHWNVLNEKERRQAINIMKHYVKKQTEIKEKRLRQSINAIWIKSGHTRDELHSVMADWGYGVSLRALEYNDLLSVLGNVKKAVGGTRDSNK